MSLQQEQLRHQYLEAMGISSWLPCAPLPGAAPSADWLNDFQYPAPEIPFASDRSATARSQLGLNSQNPAPLSPVAKTPPAPPGEGMSAARAALGLSSVPGETDPEPAAEEATVETEGPRETGAEVQPPRFKLAFQRIADLLVVDSLPPQGGAFAEHYQHLATAIVAALGSRGEIAQPFMLPWPMFASKTLDQGPQQARIAVQHKLSKELQSGDIRAVLLFGEAAAQMVLERSEELAELKGISFTLRSDVKVIASHSLTEAMQLPGIKKQIWLDLQPLLKQLNAR
ncbi:hypothetical protein [Neptuniibacter halophilus]|uniref:hypothetical protein n=1 Tax=Neptuniibacter halophilus TaxID=651666 RepID=UPI00257253C8|nr:hypothetical protein [Neptuniibacter halophilus]